MIPTPREIPGEAPRYLPNGVVIDFNNQAWNNAYSPVLQAPGGLSYAPTRGLRTPAGATVTAFEIMFAPSGALIGQNSSVNMAWFWVRNVVNADDPTTWVTDNNASNTRLTGRPVLVTVQSRNGFIAQHPVNPHDPAGPPPDPRSDPYKYARDGRSSGM
jgi:hypothetical protein